MADRSLADYIMEQLAGLDGVRRRPMMGGWLFYYRGRLFGGAMFAMRPSGYWFRRHSASHFSTTG